MHPFVDVRTLVAGGDVNDMDRQFAPGNVGFVDAGGGGLRGRVEDVGLIWEVGF